MNVQKHGSLSSEPATVLLRQNPAAQAQEHASAASQVDAEAELMLLALHKRQQFAAQGGHARVGRARQGQRDRLRRKQLYALWLLGVAWYRLFQEPNAFPGWTRTQNAPGKRRFTIYTSDADDGM